MRKLFFYVILVHSAFSGTTWSRGNFSGQSVAQARVAFDVVSIKSSDPKSLGFSIRPKPNQFMVRGASIKFLIGYAYHLHDFQISGLPAWAKTARFDIDAKMDDESIGISDRAQGEKLLEERLQTILIDRFHLSAHESNQPLAVYRLEVENGGSKLRHSHTNTGYTSSTGLLVCSDTTMESLASMLSDELNEIVLDKTGLTGSYEFSLKWTPAYLQTEDSADPGIFTSLKEQLGLRLVPAKEPVPVLTIDGIQQPSGN